MRAQTFTKFGIGLVAITLATCTLAAPASADPANGAFGTLVGTGSDTTQDVVGALAAEIGGTDGLRIGSYDATGPVDITTGTGVTFKRPNNSGTGRDILRLAIGNIPETFSASINGISTTWAQNEVEGNVDFARSSSGPGKDENPAGVLTYVPFAKDAVTFATSADSVIPPLALGSDKDVTGTDGVGTASLYSIYHGFVTRVITDTATGSYLKVVNDKYTAAAGETSTPIHAYVPQSGSGTRSFWIGKVVITEDQITQKAVPVTATYGPDNKAIQEHDGSALVGDKGAIVPFSVGQWVVQGNGIGGVTDRRNGAKLGVVNGQEPTTGTAGNYALNTGYSAITRTVYNIVPTTEALDKTSLTNWAFVGTGSLICSQKDIIKKYGFGLLTGTGVNACGDTSTKGFIAAPASVTLNVKSAVKYGTSLALSAGVASNNNGGGTVDFYNGETKLATVKVAKGAKVANFTYKTTAATTVADLNLSADFTPTLSGVGEATSPLVAVDVQTATSTVKATVASVAAKVAPVAKVKVTAPGVFATGSVTIKEGTKTLKAGAKLNSTGAVNVTLPKLKKGTHKLVVSYTGSKLVAAGKSATITVKIK